MFVIPTDFTRMIIDFHGTDGLDWLNRLPTILADCEQRWNLTIKPPFANLSFHYVAPAIRADGTPVVLKAHALTGEFAEETEALRLFGGHGMV